MCPVKALEELALKGQLADEYLKRMGAKQKMMKFLQVVTGSGKPVSLYALRIGGRTWNISQGLDRQFVDYLGTWKSPEVSARYYREEPAAVLLKIKKFYLSLPEPKTI